MAGKVLYNNLVIGATITAAHVNPYTKDNAQNWDLFSFWQGSGGTNNTYTIDLGTAQEVDCCAVYGHDLPDNSASVLLEWSNDGATGWTSVFTAVSPTDKVPVFKTFTAQTKRYWRFTFDGAGGASKIAIIALGKHLEFQKGWRTGYRPAGLFNNVQRTQNVSEGGIPLGYNTVTLPGKYRIQQTLVTPAWVRASWQPFVEAAEQNPFFFSWNEASYPWEAVFAWKTKKIVSAEYTHFNERMRVTMDIEALHDL